MNNNKRGHHGFIHEVAKNRYLYLLALPGMLFLLVFAYTPMLGHLLAFQNYRLSDGLLGSQWVGWRNFEFFFSTNDWLRVTWNTVFLNGLFLVFGRYHIHDPRLSVESIADHIELSAKYSRQLFLDHYGMSLSNYILNMRIEKVKELLTETDMSVAEIAQQAGFQTKSHFFTAFKKATGMTPAQYRCRQMDEASG